MIQKEISAPNDPMLADPLQLSKIFFARRFGIVKNVIELLNCFIAPRFLINCLLHFARTLTRHKPSAMIRDINPIRRINNRQIEKLVRKLFHSLHAVHQMQFRFQHRPHPHTQPRKGEKTAARLNFLYEKGASGFRLQLPCVYL